MSAVRLARAFTHRDRIVKFAGGYHGHADAFLAAAGSGLATPWNPVLAGRSPRGDRRHDRRRLQPHRRGCGGGRELRRRPRGHHRRAGRGKHVASYPVFPAFEALRGRCAMPSGALLIFDEVITGFRVGLGGAQARFGVMPDLTILGKIVGGGLPLAAFGGRADVMSRLAPAGDVYQAGTLSGNPLRQRRGRPVCLAPPAGRVDLRRARAPGGSTGGRSRPVRPRPAGRRHAHVLRAGDRAVERFTVVTSDPSSSRHRALRRSSSGTCSSRGIYVAPSQYECLFPSLAHGDEEIDATIEAVGDTTSSGRSVLIGITCVDGGGSEVDSFQVFGHIESVGEQWITARPGLSEPLRLRRRHRSLEPAPGHLHPALEWGGDPRPRLPGHADGHVADLESLLTLRGVGFVPARG